MKESWSLRFLYETAPGRVVLKGLIHPWISKVAGCFLSSRFSKWLIPGFKEKNQIDMTGVIVPEGGFACFNDFFARRRETESLSVKKGQLISPCDGFIRAIKIEDKTVLDVKHSLYSVEDLLADAEMAERFRDGVALVFRLTPANYHRYCYPVTGAVTTMRRIEGVLHCVRPIALRTNPVFVQNSREYQVIETKEFGNVVQMEVGALLVGKIKNHPVLAGESFVQMGREKGYFEFGGSTIILLFEKDRIVVDLKWCGEEEAPIRLGDVVGTKLV